MALVHCPTCSGQQLFLAEAPQHTGAVPHQYATYATQYSAVLLGCRVCNHVWLQYSDGPEPTALWSEAGVITGWR